MISIKSLMLRHLIASLNSVITVFAVLWRELHELHSTFWTYAYCFIINTYIWYRQHFLEPLISIIIHGPSNAVFPNPNLWPNGIHRGHTALIQHYSHIQYMALTHGTAPNTGRCPEHKYNSSRTPKRFQKHKSSQKYRTYQKYPKGLGMRLVCCVFVVSSTGGRRREAGTEHGTNSRRRIFNAFNFKRARTHTLSFFHMHTRSHSHSHSHLFIHIHIINTHKHTYREIHTQSIDIVDCPSLLQTL